MSEISISELVRQLHADAIAIFDAVLPAAAALVDRLNAADRTKAVLVLADREDAAGRAFSDEMLGHVPPQPDDADATLFYTVQPAEAVASVFAALNLLPMPPLLAQQPDRGTVRVLIITNGVHNAFIWTPNLSKGGCA